MSDSVITIIPSDPRSSLDPALLGLLVEKLVEITGTEEVEIINGDGIQFFDCGQNFERMICPMCGTEIDSDWWMAKMDEDYRGEGFILDHYDALCCWWPLTLADVIYEWPQGFAKWGLVAGIGMTSLVTELTPDHEEQFGNILGSPIRVIYRRY